MALPAGARQLHADPAGVGDLHGVAGSGGQRPAVQVLFLRIPRTTGAASICSVQNGTV